jgi:hypothetical protein
MVVVRDIPQSVRNVAHRLFTEKPPWVSEPENQKNGAINLSLNPEESKFYVQKFKKRTLR